MPEPDDRQPADATLPGFFERLLDRADPLRVLRFLLRPATRWVICWLIALGLAGFLAEQAWTEFGNPESIGGNYGHTLIDFGGQWIVGRMIVEGHGRQLYNRNYLRFVAKAHYPAHTRDPRVFPHGDAENLLTWMAGSDDERAPKVVASFLGPLVATNVYEEAVLLARGKEMWTVEEVERVTAPHVGGALYPPIHALLYAPLTLLPPRIAYRVVQALILALVFFDGWVIQRMTEGRVWWPVASVFLMVFPGLGGCLYLGQNGLFSLTLLLLGWWQLMRGRDGRAGLCWGLLAFKPVWAASFFLVPLLTRRWRMAATMAVAGLVQIALTLPVVGWRTWLDWLHVSRMAADRYVRDHNWIFLSRDLLGIPRRWLLDFDEYGLAQDVDKNPLPTVLGWGLWATVLLLTLYVAWRCRKRAKAVDGPAASFALMGAIFACYHFMYYDFVLAALPLLLLFTEPRRYLRDMFGHWPPRHQGRKTKDDNSIFGLLHCKIECVPVPPLLLFLMLVVPRLSYLLVSNANARYHPPLETFVLLLSWVWCGYCLLANAGESISSTVPAGVAPEDAIRADERNAGIAVPGRRTTR